MGLKSFDGGDDGELSRVGLIELSEILAVLNNVFLLVTADRVYSL